LDEAIAKAIVVTVGIFGAIHHGASEGTVAQGRLVGGLAITQKKKFRSLSPFSFSNPHGRISQIKIIKSTSQSPQLDRKCLDKRWR
jgi:hypothetical protein